MTIQFCKRCVMPNTRPGIVFDDQNICSACRNYERRKTIDWDKRFRELEYLCDKYRGSNGNSYDCAIAISGGKDSHYQVYVMKELMKMHPLLLTVNPDTWTQTGRKNINNISMSFGCDIISLDLNKRTSKILALKSFRELGMAHWYYDAAIYAFPLRMAINLGIKLLVYGENVSYEYGGPQQNEETYSAKKQIENDVVKPIDICKWCDNDVSEKDFIQTKYPSYQEIENAGLEPIYLSYFVPWSSLHNYEVAQRYGFCHIGHEWSREGFLDTYTQIDSAGYLLSQWLKYPKFGHASVTEAASRMIRYGLMSREEAVKVVNKKDHILDQRIVEDFISFTGISYKEFWSIVDKWYNQDLFEKGRDGIWKKKFCLK